MNYQKYRPFPPVNLADRQWPGRVIQAAPIWCSVDLRDGNQALEVPMSFEQKLAFFQFLVKIGFKEIEVGFPAASDTEYRFCRALIERNLIPEDVTIQVLTQSREHIIRETFEALKGAKNAVVHLYNSTSTLQRDVVFGMNCQEVKQLAVDGAVMIRDLAKEYGAEHYQFEYSPESFTGTELDYAVEVCNAVLEVWQPVSSNKVIINLPATVEMSTPNIYADQIEYVCRHIQNRDQVLISLHTHNDRGCAVAASELGLLAGADRIEGTLFGNGERTGNADILVMAMNLFSQGIDPKLELTKMDDVIAMYEDSTRMLISQRHPYAGNLVYTAFSGSHQDAIKKGLARIQEHPDYWEVPYLPIDPADVGRSYDPIIRINSQSGKGGVAYILEQYYGLHLPKNLQKDFGALVTKVSDTANTEMKPEELYELFLQEYIEKKEPLELIYYTEMAGGTNQSDVQARMLYQGKEIVVHGSGNGVISAFCKALEGLIGYRFEVVNYTEHSLEVGSKSRAITYIHITDMEQNHFYGAGTSSNITKSSLRAVVASVNKMLATK